MSLAITKTTDISPLRYNDKCDKYDYLIAVACGAIAGLVDIFFVGSPTDSKLQNWTDAQVDKAVMNFSKLCGWKPKDAQANNVKSAIGFLENGSAESRKKGFYGFKVNYDHRYSSDVNDLFRMGTKNHHMKSLAHSPDIVGLFFSILNQFTSTASFVSDGNLITIQTETQELQGHNFISKLFCGVANWFGHLMSDIAGSSGGRGNSTGRGSGIVMPFYELFGFCDFGKFNISTDPSKPNLVSLASLATRTFQEGYDARFGITMAIPVLLCDLSIRLIWAIRHFFQYKKPLNECIPTQRHDDLRVMLLFGNGTLCIMDGADAAIRSGGSWLNFFLRLNLIAWFRFVTLVLKEICIRVGLSFPLQNQIDAFKRINAALIMYMEELEKLDVEQFRKETEAYNSMMLVLEKADSEEALNYALTDIFDKLGIEAPWQGDFDDFMEDEDAVLVFE